MDRKARIGLFGGGGIIGAHVAGYRASADTAEVVAVAEPTPEKAERIHQLYGDEVVIYSDYEELLNRADVDAVDICLPHDLHMPATLAAAKAGKHVLTEKVMARNVWECDRMIDACEAAGVTLTVCHDRRYHPGWKALKQVVDSGVLGEISYWKLDHNQDVNPGSARHIPWAADRDRLGGGAIMSCLTHQIDALRWYGGDATQVTCMTKTLPKRMAGETIGVVTAQMASGALAQLSINWMTRSNAKENGLWYEMVQVCGTEGEAYFMHGEGTFALSHTGSNLCELLDCEEPIADNGFVKLKVDSGGGHERCIGEWIKLVREEAAEICTSGREVRGTVEVAEAAYRSAETGHHVALPIEPKPWPTELG